MSKRVSSVFPNSALFIRDRLFLVYIICSILILCIFSQPETLLRCHLCKDRAHVISVIFKSLLLLSLEYE
ncbi:hypothetical protein L596_024364 [Steinernema carpocapsae]|uniref:Uncharacterized protein n=1 Tax=Steinernema carpocapsae TaxID=34508 RepID=A0A4U5MGK3_STECR|nr:hypothetical protein L596_024364 [Steinernema carpocapsae]